MSRFVRLCDQMNEDATEDPLVQVFDFAVPGPMLHDALITCPPDGSDPSRWCE